MDQALLFAPHVSDAPRHVWAAALGYQHGTTEPRAAPGCPGHPVGASERGWERGLTRRGRASHLTSPPTEAIFNCLELHFCKNRDQTAGLIGMEVKWSRCGRKRNDRPQELPVLRCARWAHGVPLPPPPPLAAVALSDRPLL